MVALLHAGHAAAGNVELVVASVFLAFALAALAWPKRAASTARARRRRPHR